ncbi:MAG: family 16 glycosylhydrolase [Chloroflexi bacterium]|nr:family 16 glycosylhydrolase [Chloroflexota bacterium]
MFRNRIFVLLVLSTILPVWTFLNDIEHQARTAAFPIGVSARPQNQTALSLVWSDEFDDPSVNTNDWNYEIGGGGWGNNELEYYTNGSNASIQNGALVIEARKENVGGYQYTSTRMTTQGKHEFMYGQIEARIALPSGQGLWPAFWMLGSNIGSVGWPASGEIDIMEHINNEDMIHGTIHWDAGGHASYGCSSFTIDVTQYHIYDIVWDMNGITWYVDGTQYCQVNTQNNINSTEEFHRPFFILLNLAVGGNWPGSPDASTVFPAKMYVDYVRVYTIPGTTFTDVPPYYWAWDWIERLYAAGITGGCATNPLRYCPEDSVTRAQMAVFLEKGLHGSGFTPPTVPVSFSDTSGHWAQDWIEALYSDGITAGCGGGNYCPDASTTRAQMAVFLLRAKHGSGYTPPPATGSMFSDVSSSHWAVDWIEQLAVEGITGGCGTNLYCPESPVTRAQMAVFLVKTFGLP